MRQIISNTLVVQRLCEHAIIPQRASPLAAGLDLHASQDTVVPAKGKGLVSTGLAIQLPPQSYGRIAPRSGLACKHFIDVGAGVIDQDYRGQVKVLLFNFGENEFKVNQGDRIAQLIVQRILPVTVTEGKLDESVRGEAGFGSTGT